MRFFKGKDFLQIEEIIADRIETNFLERPLEQRVFQIVYISILIISIVFFGRTFLLIYERGDVYAERAMLNANAYTVLPAERGVIVDRFGVPLAQNQPTFSAFIKISDYRANETLIAGALMDTLGISEDELKNALATANLEKNDAVRIASDLEPEELIRLKSRSISGLEIRDDFRRLYPAGEALAHSLGYVDFEGVARDGIELFYDDILKGQDGMKIALRNAKGEALGLEETINPLNGKKLEITLDVEFQLYFYKRLKDAINDLGRRNGAGLAIDPRSGEILAAISIPAYDNNLFTKKGTQSEREAKTQILNSADRPLFNRAILGMYNPASTIKPLHATAALAEGVVTTDKSIFSAGFIELPNPYSPDNPSRFADWAAHGWVNVYSALARSSNVYFYSVGGGFEDVKGLGITRLIDWWKKFGLGKKTGIDFPYESEGFLPNPEEKEARTGTIWRIGDTYNVSIGQGDLLVTPLQLVNYIGAIANGGHLMKPHFKQGLPSEQTGDLTQYAKEISEVRLGMRNGVDKSYGTSFMLNDLPLPTAGKTGSAQFSNNTKTNAFFVGFGPYDKDGGPMPEIAVLILVEDAKAGSLNAVPIAHDVLKWYYENRILSSSTATSSDQLY